MSKQKQSIHDNAMARTLMAMLAQNAIAFTEINLIMNLVLMWEQTFDDEPMTIERLRERSSVKSARMVELVLELMSEAGVASFEETQGGLKITYGDPTEELMWWRVHRAYMAEGLGWGHLYVLLTGIADRMDEEESDSIELTPEDISDISGGAPYELLAKRFDDIEAAGLLIIDREKGTFTAGPAWIREE